MARFQKSSGGFYLIVFITLVILDIQHIGVQSWQGHSYWNDRYQSKDADWVEYTAGESQTIKKIFVMQIS